MVCMGMEQNWAEFQDPNDGEEARSRRRILLGSVNEDGLSELLGFPTH